MDYTVKTNILSPVETHETLWRDCLKVIKDNVPPITYSTWFLPIRPVSIEDEALKVKVPNNFFIEWIDEHFNTLISKTMHNVIGPNSKLVYLVDDKPQIDLEPEPVRRIQPVKVEPVTLVKEREAYDSHLYPKHSFESFVNGDGNQLARAASYAVSENPGETSFNPLFIYGGVGLGKTHLIQAIGNRCLQLYPEKRVIYLSSDFFTVEFVEAVQSNKTNEFSNFYKSMDVLIIDDIQFLIGKEKTQDLFFQIFNNLHQSGKQIVLSSDKPPKDLKGLNERLISRFLWGLSADIQPPDLETRIAILNKKSENYGICLSQEIVEYIAANITNNVRELEGCLIRLLANSSLNSKDINLELAKRTVREISTDKKVKISIEFITKKVCEHLNVTEDKIRDKNRKKEIALARQIAMFLSKKLTNSSLKTIGLHFGGRDHSTVIHAYNLIESLLRQDPKLNEVVETIQNKIEISSM